jgi:two-component system OmpR family sensor kinase
MVSVTAAGGGPIPVAVEVPPGPVPVPAGPDGRSAGSQWWDRVPLRVKLVAAVLALVAFALIVVGVGSVFALRHYLVQRVDGQLIAARDSITDIETSPRQPTRTEIWPPSDFVVALQDTRGTMVVATYHKEQLPAFPSDLSTWQGRVGDLFTAEGIDHGRHWRLLVSRLADGRILVMGEDLSNVDSSVGRLVLINALVGVSVLVALALVGVWLVRVSLRPLAAMERTAAAIAGGDLTRRVPELDPRTELGQFSAALNTMLAQIELAFLARAASEERAIGSEERMRQFVADASHELRTPLTTIRGFAELYRQGAAPDPTDVLRRIEDEAARMGLLVEDLLLLARLDRERPLRRVPVALAGLLTDTAAAAHAVAPERTVDVEIAPEHADLVVDGDEARLRQVIGNLVTNALTHTPAGTEVTLRLYREDGSWAVIEVADSGPGLAPEQARRVFERFYRVDKARTRKAATSASVVGRTGGLNVPHSGAGLGLAIVAALVAAHGGTVDLRTAPGEGATFRVRLPVARPAEA